MQKKEGKRQSIATTRDNIQGKLLGPNAKEINIEKFRDIKATPMPYKLNGKLNEQILKTISNKFSTELIFNLDLQNQTLATLDGLQECKNLIILNVSKNLLKDLFPLQNCTSLTFLNVSSNQISALETLKVMKQLQNIHAEDNKIKGTKGLKGLEQCDSLYALSLQSLSSKEQNPICLESNYREDVLGMLPQILRLDSIPRGLKFDNGSELDSNSKEQVNIDLTTNGAYYTPVFPKQTPFEKDGHFQLDGEEALKNSLKDCKLQISSIEARMKALLA